jgi:putative NADH-flavin reductase
MRLVVFGASGGCGSHLVRQAAARGHHVTAVVRPESSYQPPNGVMSTRGNVLHAGFVAAAIDGHDAVASCLGMRYAHPWARRQSPDDFISRATTNIVSGMKAAGARRICVISAAGVAESRPAANVVIRFLIPTSNVGVAYADLATVEEELRHSGLDWQAVRPTTLSNRPGRGTARLTTSFPMTASIAREDVAAFMLGQLEASSFVDRTPMITG